MTVDGLATSLTLSSPFSAIASSCTRLGAVTEAWVGSLHRCWSQAVTRMEATLQPAEADVAVRAVPPHTRYPELELGELILCEPIFRREHIGLLEVNTVYGPLNHSILVRGT